MSTYNTNNDYWFMTPLIMEFYWKSEMESKFFNFPSDTLVSDQIEVPSIFHLFLKGGWWNIADPLRYHLLFFFFADLWVKQISNRKPLQVNCHKSLHKHNTLALWMKHTHDVLEVSVSTVTIHSKVYSPKTLWRHMRTKPPQ